MFLSLLYELFDDTDTPQKMPSKSVIVISQDKITTIIDQNILDRVELLLKNNKVLECIGICLEFYKKSYPNMTFRDWSEIVIKLHQKICSENT